MSEEFQNTEPGVTADQEFQHQWDIADAKLGVAEQLAWPLAMGWGLAAGFMLHHWLPGVLVFAVAYYVVRHPYSKDSRRFDQLHQKRVFGSNKQ